MAMRFEHEFTVPVPVEQAWSVLLDVERIAPCLPGTALEKAEGDSFTGRMKVKVGPITVTYRGEAAFENVDEDARILTLRASGRETRGSGTASATVTARLRPDDAGGLGRPDMEGAVGTAGTADSEEAVGSADTAASGGPAGPARSGGPADSVTRVIVETSFNVTGRPAQFGRGVMGEVGAKLIDRFAANLAALLEAGEAGTATAGTAPLTPVPAPEPAVPEKAPPGRATGTPEAAVQGTTGAPRANGQGTTGGPGTDGQGVDGASEADGRGSAGRGADGRKETARHLTAVPSPTETPEGAEAAEAKEPERPDTPETAGTPAVLTPVTGLPPVATERTAGRDAHPAGTSRTSLTPDEEALDLMEIAGMPLLRRAAPLLAAVAGLAVAAWLTRRALRRR
ncbi:SRPBCC family protein [Streptosporangium sp. NPDC004379]|uniref:SRPBCC family protein n=1 Tax=Streptosporangium sp. NPDC004379 TaxID=3366189 RepID=UPI00367958BB